MTSSEVFEATKVTNENIYKTVFENVDWKFGDPTWVSTTTFMLKSCLICKDLKATALLKLIYLEMFGHDMSWASFHVLEVMSSAKYLQKRVGYLGAVQSFRSDTEVLMLATNLLKKVSSANLPPCHSLLDVSGRNIHIYANNSPCHNYTTSHSDLISRAVPNE